MNDKFDINKSLVSKELLKKFPDWWRYINPEEHYLVCSDDCDSLFACERLHTLFGLEIGGFYSFEGGLYTNDEITDSGWKTPIYVDLSVAQEQMCFDNHLTFVPNSNSINPNVIHKGKYNERYNLSTLALVIALYGGIDKMSDFKKEVIIAVDGCYVGYYKDGGRWKDVNMFWLDKLGLSDSLLPILEKRSNKYFEDFRAEHCLEDKITINGEGYLETPTYRVPDRKFELEKSTEKEFMPMNEAIDRYRNGEKIFVSAQTFGYGRNYILNIEKCNIG